MAIHQMVKYFLKASCFVASIIFLAAVPGLPPHTTFPTAEFNVTLPRELEGPLAINKLLDYADHILKNEINGPETIIGRGDTVYMGLNGGNVAIFKKGLVMPIFQIGKPCKRRSFDEAVCGRPLGLAFDTKGNNIIVADAYYGIWRVDLKKYRKTLLVSPKQILPGKFINRKAKIFNGVAVDSKGDIYWTDSSSDFTFEDSVLAGLTNPSGRLFKYDRSKNISTVLLDELFFANGVAISPQEDFVVVAETGGMRLMKYYVDGIRTGESEIFIDGLPGHPDNLTPDENGIWVPLVSSADKNNPSGFAALSQSPQKREFIIRLLTIFEMPFKFVEHIIPNPFSKYFIHFIGHSKMFSALLPKRTTIIRLDWNGNIVGAMHGFDGSASMVSHVYESGKELLLGSPVNRYVTRVFLKVK
ncbi:adipocyte plasma membrane-associated protein-like [Teleopsis dalmanni]|uniref:adipocyte plasma membrane-associated protein-like n=1 Tax=Teleopsis dalmanni TaxID=139649 RepID=UPI0018CFBA92|nr:adipocyte plasma membrane-associated protein-like [Teleopsis dalmanni]